MHLNLANNRIKSLSLTHLPVSVSSLDLSNNLLKDVPYDLDHLRGLEHLELEGNPLDCSCDNILVRDRLVVTKVLIDNVRCASPAENKGKSWLELKTKDVCKLFKNGNNMLDKMMGDMPINPVQVGEDAAALKLSSFDDSEILGGAKESLEKKSDDDDDLEFIKVNRKDSSNDLKEIEGSGDFEQTSKLSASKSEYEIEVLTDDPFEGSGYSSDFEGSGFGWNEEETDKAPVETTTVYTELFTGPIVPLIADDGNSGDFPSPSPVTVYIGGPNWHLATTESLSPRDNSDVVTEAPVFTSKPIVDTTVSEQIRITQAAEINEQPALDGKTTPHKTGTYVCIAIIVVLLVGLVGYAVAKGQIRKRRDRRLLRQQKRDIEQAAKEMVDMNKSLLGKPAMLDSSVEKKLNGTYELVPTQEKKDENGGVGNGVKHANTNGKINDSPRDTNQNKNSSRDNNKANDQHENSAPKDTSFGSAHSSSDSGKDNHSLSSEDIFVPINDEIRRLNGTALGSELSQPLLNGDQTLDPNFLLPSEYAPVYSPDMGRVRIKLTETPKPKTPVLVTRSRSNAGDIIITPSSDEKKAKPTT